MKRPSKQHFGYREDLATIARVLSVAKRADRSASWVIRQRVACHLPKMEQEVKEKKP